MSGYFYRSCYQRYLLSILLRYQRRATRSNFSFHTDSDTTKYVHMYCSSWGGDQYLANLLICPSMYCHPKIIEELPSRNLLNSALAARRLRNLQQTKLFDDSLFVFIEQRYLYCRREGYFDFDLFVSSRWSIPGGCRSVKKENIRLQLIKVWFTKISVKDSFGMNDHLYSV